MYLLLSAVTGQTVYGRAPYTPSHKVPVKYITQEGPFKDDVLTVVFRFQPAQPPQTIVYESYHPNPVPYKLLKPKYPGSVPRTI